MNLKERFDKPKMICPLMCWEFMLEPASREISEKAKRIKARVKLSPNENQASPDQAPDPDRGD